jgi:hypothetical protein
MPATKYLTQPGLTVEIGKKIYNERYRDQYEPLHNGKFLAIDVESGVAALGETSSEAMLAGRMAVPDGWFYLMRVGFPTAFVHR